MFFLHACFTLSTKKHYLTDTHQFVICLSVAFPHPNSGFNVFTVTHVLMHPS